MSASSSSRKSRKAISSSHVFYKNAVYFPNHRLYSGDTPGSLNYSCISTVYYCFASISPDGGVFLSDEYADVRAPCDGVSGGLGSFMYLKQKHPHLQVVLSIGGGGSGQTFATIAASPILRDNLARSARGLVEASGLDGLDIMWQYPMDLQQGSSFLALIAAIRLYLPEEHYLLTAALPSSSSILANIDICRAADYLDLLNIMTYDFYGAWTGRSGHHAQLYSGKDNDTSGSGSISYLVAQGFPAKKILLGIPVFGRSFLGVAGPGQGFKGVGGKNGEFEYNELPRKGTKEQVDKKACAAYCVGGDGGFVSYDNPETVKQKAAFCRQKGLGGLFYWTAPADSKDAARSLVAAGFRALHSA